MKIFESYLLRLRALTVFRGILENNVMRSLCKLLQAGYNSAQLRSDTTQKHVCATALADAWGAFAAALYVHTDCFSDYLLKAVLDDENLYVYKRSDNVDISPESPLACCVETELAFLQELSLFDGAALRALADSACPLPTWTTAQHNFKDAYAQRMFDLPRKGYGIFAKYSVFTIKDGVIVPVKHPDTQPLATLSGYEHERGKVMANTRALLEGRPASNVLLYGDAGTGKSSTVKAVAGALCAEGLRLIEVKKNQLYQIPDLVEMLGHNPLKFILFIDDLSFSTNDDDFAALKGILEGSVSTHSGNLAVYATSNRRHLVKETFSNREGDEIHLADTMQELMSLSARFGLSITFSRPDKELYGYIVQNLATLYGLELDSATLLQKAEAHALRSGGRSPRVAKQFVELLMAEI